VGLPVAAPSANRFGRVSPTTADHVRRDLGRNVAFILDGGACQVGVESTIVSASEGVTRILRPGGLSKEAIEHLLGHSVEVGALEVRVSGALPSHYAPRARVVTAVPGELSAAARFLRKTVHRLIILKGPDVRAENLYRSLREADDAGADVILAELPTEEGIGLAIRDRLGKAAAPRP
jgi:L-threonylcarbamoyladenylate synthase